LKLVIILHINKLR